MASAHCEEIARTQAAIPARPDSVGLRRRPSNAVDRWDDGTYRRVLLLNGKPCEVAMTQIAAPNSPGLQGAITGARLTSDAIESV
jgi:hypothetical protein